MIGTRETFEALAGTYLSAGDARTWLGLMRPAVGLRACLGADETVAGQLGGLPCLPDGVAWPVWQGHGPLSFVASVDCAALPAAEPGTGLPPDGTLAFFYYDDGDDYYLNEEPATWEVARVLYLPAGLALRERADPGAPEVFPRVDLAGWPTMTMPDAWQRPVRELFAPPGADPRRRYEHPVCSEDFAEALRLDTETGHQLGGWPAPVQGAPELEIAYAALGGTGAWDEPRLAEEARNWAVLAQIDSDDDAHMMWGDCGTLYWMIRPEDLARRRFDRARFTWQCC